MKLEVIEGNRQRLDGGALFGHLPKSVWQEFFPVDQQNRIAVACRSLLIEIEGQTLLFEAGIGTFFSPKLRERYGVEGEEHLLHKTVGQREIDHVVLSHLHFDHAGGLLAPYKEGEAPSLLFPEATYWCTEEAFARAVKPTPRDKASFIPELQPLLEKSLRFFSTTLPFKGMEVVKLSSGHTKGLAVLRLETTPPLYLTTDLLPGLPWVHLPINSAYDRFPEQSMIEKQEVLDQVIAEEGVLFFTHDPDVVFAKPYFEGRRYRAEPFTMM